MLEENPIDGLTFAGVNQKLDEIDITMLNLGKKKKKKVSFPEIIDLEQKDDYDYIFLLERLYSMMVPRDPSKRKSIQPPILERMGSKKTSFSNFVVIATMLQRPQEHIKSYIDSELCIMSSISAKNQLIMCGKFVPKNIEVILKKYISEFVLCKVCKTLNTTLIKDSVTRLWMVSCDICMSVRSTITIKTGIKPLATP